MMEVVEEGDGGGKEFVVREEERIGDLESSAVGGCIEEACTGSRAAAGR